MHCYSKKLYCFRTIYNGSSKAFYFNNTGLQAIPALAVSQFEFSNTCLPFKLSKSRSLLCRDDNGEQ